MRFEIGTKVDFINIDDQFVKTSFAKAQDLHDRYDKDYVGVTPIRGEVLAVNPIQAFGERTRIYLVDIGDRVISVLQRGLCKATVELGDKVKIAGFLNGHFVSGNRMIDMFKNLGEDLKTQITDADWLNEDVEDFVCVGCGKYSGRFKKEIEKDADVVVVRIRNNYYIINEKGVELA